jgi:hypothetical protein
MAAVGREYQRIVQAANDSSPGGERRVNIFEHWWQSRHVRDWEPAEKAALLRILREFVTCDYEFAAVERRQYEQWRSLLSSDVPEPTVEAAVTLLVASSRSERVLYDFIAESVLCDLKNTPEERALLERLERSGFNRRMLDAAIARGQARTGQAQAVETSRLVPFIRAHLDILRKFSGDAVAWKRLCTVVRNILNEGPFAEVQLPLTGRIETDAPLLNGVLSKAGLEFLWHGQYAGRLVFEVRVHDPAQFGTACQTSGVSLEEAVQVLIAPFLNESQRIQVGGAETAYGLEWVEFPLMPSNQSALAAESDFRLFGESHGACYRVDLGRVLDAHAARDALPAVVALFRDHATRFSREREPLLDPLAFREASGSYFFVGHELFWHHANAFLTELLDLGGLPFSPSFLLTENMQEVFLRRIEDLQHVVFLSPAILGPFAVHNIILGPVVRERDVGDDLLGERVGARVVWYDGDASGVPSLFESSAFSPKPPTILVDVTQRHTLPVMVEDVALVPADQGVWTERTQDFILLHEELHCLFHQLVPADTRQGVRFRDRTYPGGIVLHICSEVWARLVSLVMCPDVAVAELTAIRAMRSQGRVYQHTSRWVLDELSVRAEQFVQGGVLRQAEFESAIQSAGLAALDTLLAEMAEVELRVAGLTAPLDRLRCELAVFRGGPHEIQWVPETKATPDATLAPVPGEYR